MDRARQASGLSREACGGWTQMRLDPRVKQEPGLETLVPGRATEAELVSQFLKVWFWVA